ncbi:uncharacterized protein CLUP02_02458 [Colletotrichum lupini]|uniref:Uncharacterized protein n=1 Tax=Colletotrichum lupini TaxID=145971 RepID=A0A9Q8SGI8_9PEZI|nr:uncharacterized protein CLUP02_02458 [Colletotrichum lupini]UQC76992.1 hypothetical protein CLUP02_02458 [Colletotrichum lupini]
MGTQPWTNRPSRGAAAASDSRQRMETKATWVRGIEDGQALIRRGLRLSQGSKTFSQGFSRMQVLYGYRADVPLWVMSLWMGWDEMLKIIRSLLILYGYTAQRNATQRNAPSPVLFRLWYEDAQAEHFTHPAIHHTATQASQVKPTYLYLTVPEAFETVSCRQGGRWLKLSLTGKACGPKHLTSQCRYSQEATCSRRKGRVSVVGTHAWIPSPLWTGSAASGGAALVFHAGLFPVLPVWLATGQWYLDGKTAKLCAGSTGLYPPPCRVIYGYFVLRSAESESPNHARDPGPSVAQSAQQMEKEGEQCWQGGGAGERGA